MTVYLYVDDERTSIMQEFADDPNTLAVMVQTYGHAISVVKSCIKKNNTIILDLDHDLGPGKTGYDICKYIVERQYPGAIFHFHTANPVGRNNMEQLVTHYGYKVF